jgi:ankyrin repeat protein
MASKFFELDCGEDEPVVMERRDDGELIFHGWDKEAEEAAIELGFEPSPCFIVWDAVQRNDLDDALLLQAMDGDAAGVDALLLAGADVHTHTAALGKDSPLKIAARRGHAPIAKVLLDHGADIHVADEDGPDAPLGWAAAKGRLDVVKLLLEHGADVHATNFEGPDAPLRWADGNNHPHVARFIRAWIAEHG